MTTASANRASIDRRTWSGRFEHHVERAVHHRHAFWWLTLITALENTVVPLTVEPVVVPLMVIYRDRILALAAAMFVGSVIGGVIMYGAGAGLISAFLPELAGGGDHPMQARFDEWLASRGFWAIFVVALTPLPYEVATLGAGGAAYPFWLFVLSITVGLALLYLGLAMLATSLGRTAGRAIERHKRWIVFVGTGVGLVALCSLLLF